MNCEMLTNRSRSFSEMPPAWVSFQDECGTSPAKEQHAGSWRAHSSMLRGTDQIPPPHSPQPFRPPSLHTSCGKQHRRTIGISGLSLPLPSTSAQGGLHAHTKRPSLPKPSPFQSITASPATLSEQCCLSLFTCVSNNRSKGTYQSIYTKMAVIILSNTQCILEYSLVPCKILET
jgi:hypothetical protein